MARSHRPTGHVREKRPGVWEVSAEGRPDPHTGARARRWRTVHGSRRDADRALAVLVAELAEGRTVARSGTLAAVAEDWWHTMATHRWEDATSIRHRQDLDVHLLPALGRRKLDAIEPADLNRLYTRMTVAGSSPRTVQHVHNTLRAVCNWALRQGLLARNPADAAVVPVRRRVPRTLPDLAQLEAVLQLAADDADGFWSTWLRVAFFTGARPAEVCALRWEHIDFDRNRITFAGAIGRALLPDGRIGWREKGTKTQTERHSGQRTVAIDLATAAALRRWRLELAAILLELGELLAADRYVFPADVEASRPITPATPSRRWRRYARAVGVDERVRLYDASRHHHISWCLTMGFPVAEVAERVGNSPETIWRTYAHLLGGDGRAIASAIDNVMEASRNGTVNA